MREGEILSWAQVKWTDNTGKKNVDFWKVITDPRRPGTWTTWFERTVTMEEK